MGQSSVIAFYLVAGFIIYVTVKGELPQYAALLNFGTGNTTNTTAAPGSLAATVQGITDTAQKAIGTLPN